VRWHFGSGPSFPAGWVAGQFGDCFVLFEFPADAVIGVVVSSRSESGHLIVSSILNRPRSWLKAASGFTSCASSHKSTSISCILKKLLKHS